MIDTAHKIEHSEFYQKAVFWDKNSLVEMDFFSGPTVDVADDVLSSVAKEDPDGNYYKKALRGPNDVVLSGPVIGGWGPGRYFRSKALAKRYLELKYGAERVRSTGGWTRGRWAYLIKDLKRGMANAT
jgi:CTP-dependent riboflavin kinase